MEKTRNIFPTLVLEKNPSYVQELERKYDIFLPPVFKAFVQTFEFGTFVPSQKHKIIHTNEEIGYERFNASLEKAIKVYFNQDELYTSPKLLPIIISGFYHYGICLGIEKDNSDKIFLFEDHDDLTFISANILEFVSQLREVHWDSI